MPFGGRPHQRGLAAPAFPSRSRRRHARGAPSPRRSLPVRAAVISAVSPSGSAVFGSAPAFSSRSIIAALPFDAGERERRDAVAIRRLTLAPARISSSTISASSPSPPSGAPSCRRPRRVFTSHAPRQQRAHGRLVRRLDRVDQRGTLGGARACRRRASHDNNGTSQLRRVTARHHALHDPAVRRFAILPVAVAERCPAARRPCRAASGAGSPAASAAAYLMWRAALEPAGSAAGHHDRQVR